MPPIDLASGDKHARSSRPRQGGPIAASRVMNNADSLVRGQGLSWALILMGLEHSLPSFCLRLFPCAMIPQDGR